MTDNNIQMNANAAAMGSMAGTGAAYAQGGIARKLSIGGIIAAVGYLLMFISVFLPLYTSVWESANQMDIPVIGMVSLIVSLAGLAVAAVAALSRNKILLLIVTVIEVLYALIAVIIFAIAKSEFGFGMVSFGIGFYFWIIGIVAALAGTIRDYTGKR